MLRVAFLTTTDPLDVSSWSGTPYHMLRSLEERGHDVTPIGPLATRLRRSLGAYGKLRRLVRPGKYLAGHSRAFARAYGLAAGRRMAPGRFDVAVAPAAGGAIAYLTTDVPVVYLSDATFSLMVDYNPNFTGLCESSLRDGEEIERLAIERAAAVSYPSEWAAASAVRDYGAARAKVRVIPFGVNLKSVPPREAVLDRPRGEGIRLLFVGRNWERKGGDVALEALEALHRGGVDASLTICGCKPSRVSDRRRVRVIPFLDKSVPEELAEMERLYLSADFLILPTRNECWGVVAAEANAFGVPAIVSNTGGLRDVVRDGLNGHALPQGSGGGEYAKAVLGLWRDEERYRALSRSSRDEYENRLNWGSWSAAMSELLSDVVRERSTGAS